VSVWLHLEYSWARSRTLVSHLHYRLFVMTLSTHVTAISPHPRTFLVVLWRSRFLCLVTWLGPTHSTLVARLARHRNGSAQLLRKQKCCGKPVLLKPRKQLQKCHLTAYTRCQEITYILRQNTPCAPSSTPWTSKTTSLREEKQKW
jgi:hypothetical protein